MEPVARIALAGGKSEILRSCQGGREGGGVGRAALQSQGRYREGCEEEAEEAAGNV